MKGLKMAIIALTAFVVVGITGCSKTIEVPDISIIRTVVPRVSTESLKVAAQFCRWRRSMFDSPSQGPLLGCASSIMSAGLQVPESLMNWRKPTTYDTDRCSLTDKSKKCEKIRRIFFMRVLFTEMNPSSYPKPTKMPVGSIILTKKRLKKMIPLLINKFFKLRPTMSISVKSTLAWLDKMNKLAK